MIAPEGTDVKIITLVDDAFVTWNNIKVKETPLYPQTALKMQEIASWRFVETLQAETLAVNFSSRGRPTVNYLISIRHPASVFHNIIFNKNPVCVYLSYPITKPRLSPEMVNDINQHRDRMHAIGARVGVAMLDPAPIDDEAMFQSLKTTKEGEPVVITADKRWPIAPSQLVDPEVFPYTVQYRELVDAGPDIRNNIKARDLKMIDTAVCTVAYRPLLGGVSTGVAKEITYSISQGKRVKVFDPDRIEGTSPFEDAIELFRDKEAFYKNVEEFLAICKNNR
jgi:hypothetical protein